MAGGERSRGPIALAAGLALLTLALTYALAVALGLGLCSENQRYAVCDQLEEPLLGWSLWVGPAALVVLATMSRRGRLPFVLLGGYAVIVASVVGALALLL